MFRDFRQVGITPPNYGPFVNIVDKPKDVDIRNMIFKGENGLPDSGLGKYLSDESSPEVVRYIETHLLQRYNDDVNLSAEYKNDDAIIQAMPLHDETFNQYEERVQKMLSDEKTARLNKERTKKVYDALKRAGLSDL